MGYLALIIFDIFADCFYFSSNRDRILTAKFYGLEKVAVGGSNGNHHVLLVL